MILNLNLNPLFRFLFLAADFDQDGFLDKVEFLAFAHPEEEDKMKPVVVEQVRFNLMIKVLSEKVYYMGYPKDCSESENWEVKTLKIIITSYYKVLFNYICGPEI